MKNNKEEVKKLGPVYCPICSTYEKPVVMARKPPENPEKDNRDYIQCDICKFRSPILKVYHRGD